MIGRTATEAENAAFDTLKRIFTNGAYSSVELDRTLDRVSEDRRAKTTALVYGVLDKSITLDFILSELVKTPPKTTTAVLLKLALYEMKFGSEPPYAVVNKYVALAKTRMNGMQGFVNAVLRASANVTLPVDGGDANSMSVFYSRPKWIIEKMIGQLGLERTRSVLSAELPRMTHIRRNPAVISEDAFDRVMSGEQDAIRTDKGYYVTRGTLRRLRPEEFTAQSLSSIYAAEAYTDGLADGISVLDLCAAPGGKAIAVAQMLPSSRVTACDVHPHRVRLIEAYAGRMRAANVKALCADSAVYRPEWKEAFDLVICDVPCTGSGLLCTSPDILLGKSADDLIPLGKTQTAILSTAAKYVKKGGRLAYSTCSLLREENEDVTDAFISTNAVFTPVERKSAKGSQRNGNIRLFPDTDSCDGFYISRMTKN